MVDVLFILYIGCFLSIAADVVQKGDVLFKLDRNGSIVHALLVHIATRE